MRTFRSVDEYVTGFSGIVRTRLDEIRGIIASAAPNAEECISYGMPAYRQNGPLVYFAGYDGHIGFYPTSTPIKFFAQELTKYKTSKGAIQFPLAKKIPAALVKKIVKFKIAENETKAKKKTKRS
jgi:uncharacterized protein YdhG (YjbR/CyaY superfamily)